MIMIFSIDFYSTKRNTFILKCFIQFTCSNLDDCQKEEGNFFNLFQKEGDIQKGVGGGEGFGGFPQKRGGSETGGNYDLWKTSMFIFMPKIYFIIHFFLEILHFKESCNLIG